MIKRIYLIIVIVILTNSAKAEGYAVNLQGNKQTGMGHVGTALNFDSSCMQWNPGTLASLTSKYSFSLGGFGTFTQSKYTYNGISHKTDNPISTPFYFYGAVKATNKLSLGLGVYTPFGNTVDWGKDWVGNYLIQDISLKSIFIQPTASYQLTNWISIGAGLNIVYGDVDLNKAINVGSLLQSPTPVNGSVNISGNKVQYGYNIGIFLQPSEKVNIGISYRSQVDVKLGYSDGNVTFTLPNAVPNQIKQLFPSGGIAATLPLPSSLNLGLAYQINKKWLVSADVNFIKWNEYKSLDFDFEKNTAVPHPGIPNATIPVVADTQSKREWDNTVTYRFGAKYMALEKLDIYAGLYFDATPTNKKYYSPETPGANKVGISTGFSYKVNKELSIDASLLYNKGKKVTGAETNLITQQIYNDPSGFKGDYKYNAWLVGIGLTYNF